jgi:hypothetical protein
MAVAKGRTRPGGATIFACTIFDLSGSQALNQVCGRVRVGCGLDGSTPQIAVRAQKDGTSVDSLLLVQHPSVWVRAQLPRE